jgi:hypothetical protein
VNVIRTIVVTKKLKIRPMMIADNILISFGMNKEAINGNIPPHLKKPIKINPINRKADCVSNAINSILYCSFAWFSDIMKTPSIIFFSL